MLSPPKEINILAQAVEVGVMFCDMVLIPLVISIIPDRVPETSSLCGVLKLSMFDIKERILISLSKSMTSENIAI